MLKSHDSSSERSRIENLNEIHQQPSMTLVKCPGCSKRYENGRGLSMHQRRCPGLEIMVKTRFKKRQENSKKRLGVKLAHHSKKARDDFRERTNSFQPDPDTETGGKRKLSVRWFKIL